MAPNCAPRGRSIAEKLTPTSLQALASTPNVSGSDGCSATLLSPIGASTGACPAGQNSSADALPAPPATSTLPVESREAPAMLRTKTSVPVSVELVVAGS